MNCIKASVFYDGTARSAKSNVFIAFEGDRLVSVGSEKPDCEVVAEGVVTPGFIDGHSHIGLARSGEPSNEEEGNEHMDSVLPLVNAIDSVYMDDSAFQESIEHGVLYSHIMPGSGNIIGGKTVLIRNFAKDIEDAFISQPGTKAALGYNPRSTTEWKGTRPTTRMGAISILKGELIKARKASNLLRRKKKSKDEIEPHVEALMDILDGRQTLMVHVHKEDDIVNLIGLVKEFGFSAVINHAGDVHSGELWTKVRKAKLNVIYGPVDAFSYKVELKHEKWQNVKYLTESGLKYCLMTDHPVVLQRNLFLQLRFFLRYGLSKEEAISLITGNAAEILKCPDIGTLKKGNKASMVIWNKDPFSLDSWPVMVIGEGKVLVE
ncbi:MAG: amidohydrolase family protein [Candidatus Thermoplasmatota archaeon]|jgi:imidazolonepropionase-like amidohydrolase|nr:amidohydrolase family protein [Candidatus Sysuiplasma jiujiangense]MBX8640357.1 amidohydrolase family protein [Candidatus Sysuiplasma jiujiangense]MBX8642155.1 amidohydrolase family protein [Candidatus Sysuiplasma jiujiangense]MCL4317350.1 amidohydrolase family protein [Candidatus Thermoplasmatota archaeon]MCL5254086.1 amidohydrolase family protein [Candidatus Thermoplasmatota archaeon]